MSNTPSTSSSPVFVASSFQPSHRTHFAGVAYTPEAIILGEEGLKHYCKAHSAEAFCQDIVDGRFYAFIETPTQYRAFTDPLAQDTLYYYLDRDSENPHWAVSNSLLGLAEYLHDKVKLSAYRPALLSFFIGGGSGIGAQPISNRTVFEEISVIPLGKTLVIEKQGSVRFEGRAADITQPFINDSYETLVTCALSEGASRLKALHEYGISLASDLTGGQDSRACFGLLSYALEDWKKVRLISNPRKLNDYHIAQSLIAHYGGKLHHNSGRNHTIDPGRAYRLWKLGSLGSYLPAYFPASEDIASHGYKINGGLILAKQFAAQSPETFAANLKVVFAQKEDHRLVSGEFFSMFDDLEVERDDPHAMDWFYLAARARYHYGRAWYSSLSFPILSPLINPKLFTASLRLDRQELDSGKLSLDILMALDPVLALHPFDAPEKSFSVEMIRTSPFWTVGSSQVSASIPYRVFSGSVEPQGKEKKATKKDLSSVLMNTVKNEMERFTRESSLINDVFSEAILDKASKDLESKEKVSTRSRRAAHVLTCGMVEALTS